MRIRITLFMLACICAQLLSVVESFSGIPRAHHQLRIRLIPDENRLVGVDTIEIVTDRESALHFTLSEKAIVSEVKLNDRIQSIRFKNGTLTLPLENLESLKPLRIEIRYQNVFNDPVPVRPVNTDNPGFGVTGTISEMGAFLLPGAGWHPELIGSAATYTLAVSAPQGMLAVTAGKSTGHVTTKGETLSTWEVSYPTDGLSLSAGPYLVKEKPVGRVRAATYFFSQSDHLADRYLAATEKFIVRYEQRFGPYPFDQFAVVENFFPTGYGFPSYTLLGTRVLQLPFIPDTSLAHEIAHCWWGNGVRVDFDSGNWSEGLTTYVSDYLNKEMQSTNTGRDDRIQMLRNYTTLVPSDQDFPLSRFLSRTDPITKTIGYDKGAMVFHMLRRLVGDEEFWAALKEIYRQRCFQKTSWKHFQETFERHYEGSLEAFFEQWVDRKGAPDISLGAVTRNRTRQGWIIAGTISQKDSSFRFGVDLSVEAETKTAHKNVYVSDRITPFEIRTDTPPTSLRVDPGYHLFRRLHPSEIPPSVNSIKGSDSLVVVVANGLLPAVGDTVSVLIRSLGLKNITMVPEERVNKRMLTGSDLLMVGFPQKKMLLPEIPVELKILKDTFFLHENRYDHPSDAFFGVFAHPTEKGRIAALFLPLSPEAGKMVTRKITHYGKYSYLVFRNGRNRDKGIWSMSKTPLTVYWEKERKDE